MNPIKKLIGEAEDLWSDDPFEVDAALEKPEVTTPEEAYKLALHSYPRRLPEKYEELIAIDPSYSLAYAKLIKKPFPLGEPAIATRADTSYEYAVYVVQPENFFSGPKRFPLGEPAISESGALSYLYAIMALRKRFPLGEPAIKNSRFWKEYKKKFKIK